MKIIRKKVGLFLVVHFLNRTIKLLHPFLEMLWRHDFQVVTIRHNLSLQLTVNHQVKFHQASFLAQTLYLLKRMNGQRMQVIIRPAVALQHNVFHHTSIRMSNANDIVKIVAPVNICLPVCYLLILTHRNESVESELVTNSFPSIVAKRYQRRINCFR